MKTLTITVSEDEYDKVKRNEASACCELYRSACTCQRKKYVDAAGCPLKYQEIEMQTKTGKCLTRAFRSITVRFYSHHPDEPNKKHYVISYYRQT